VTVQLAPSQALAQWHVANLKITYRCGGSIGLIHTVNAPISQFHPAERNQQKHLTTAAIISIELKITTKNFYNSMRQLY